MNEWQHPVNEPLTSLIIRIVVMVLVVGALIFLLLKVI
jgi:hypothetical protein